MTVNSTTNRVSYTGNGTANALAVSFPFQMQGDLKVVERVISTGVDATKVLNTDYTITGSPDSNGFYPNGGSVVPSASIANTKIWVIYRDPPITQLVQHVDNDPVPAASIDNPTDKLTMVAQRLKDRLDRAIVAPDGDPAGSMALPSAVSRLGKVLAFDLTTGLPVVSTYTSAEVAGALGLVGNLVAGSATTLATTAALLTLIPGATVIPTGASYITTGRTVPGDGGGGLFRYDSSDTTTADNGGNIRVDGAGRRWKAVLSFFVPAAMFGAVPGLADCTTVLNNAFTAAAVVGLPVGMQGMTLPVKGTLNIDLGHTWLEGQGGTLDFTLYSTTVAINLTSTWTLSGNTQVSVHRTHPVRNVRIVGPGTGTQKCFSGSPATISAVPYLAGLLFENVAVEGFAVGWDITDGMCFCTWRGCSFSGHSYAMFRSTGNSNSGENMLVENCYAIGVACFYLEELNNSNMDMTLVNCSLDGCDSGFGANTLAGLVGGAITGGVNGTYRIIGGHWETFTANLRALWVGANGHAIIDGLTWVNTYNWNVEPLRSDATGHTGGIVIDNINLNASVWGVPNNVFCAGAGRFVINRVGLNGSTSVWTYGDANNRQSDQGFAANGHTQWSPTPSLDAGDKPSGATASILLPQNTTYTFSTPCLPGQTAQALIFFKYAWTSGSVTMSLKYCDKNGNALQTISQLMNSAYAVYTSLDLTASTHAPPGTESAQLVMASAAVTQTSRFGLPRVVVR